MNRWLLVTALSTSLCSLGTAAHADAPTAFNDSTCPQANDPGRKLNSLSAGGSASSDDMMAASQGLVDAYKDCVTTSDRSDHSKNADHQSDYVIVTRVYSRLQLGRSYQRIGSFYEQLHDPVKARAAYDSALLALGEIDGILSDGTVGLVDRGSPEVRLRGEAHDLHDQLIASEKKLNAAPAASPTPAQTK